MEFNRLRGYCLSPSKSPICSNSLVASNARHYPIPLIRRQLDRIQDYSIYVDIDFKNAFHQVCICLISSTRLSIVTPWGQFQSPFMQEGTPPATGKFMEIVNNIFEGYKEWILLIHDKILILTHKTFLRMEKSMLVIRKVKFFVYECE